MDEKVNNNTKEQNNSDSEQVNEMESEEIVQEQESFLACWLLPRKKVNRLLKYCKDKLQQLSETVEKLNGGYQQCFKALKTCQDQTEKVLQHTLEKHALEPAINTVVDLADELFRLDSIAQKLLKESGCNNELKTLANELQTSAIIAREKQSYLDIEILTPARGSQLDNSLHNICGYANVRDKTLHGRICKLIKPGVKYRGNILRQPKISVFRYTESENNKNQNNERNM